MFGNKDKKNAEKELAEWLAHPNEFGTHPKSVKHKRKYRVKMMGEATDIHLVEYEMPDGTQGRGFANPITWSFLGENVNQIPDDSLITAFGGWVFLFPALQNGSATSDFVSEGEEAAYLAEKSSQGLQDVTITNRYKIGTSELFEFAANYEGSPVKGAGNTESEVGFGADDPSFHLPPIYFLLGNQLLQ
jgi:hypothetical protein